jgi:hypothetical protein
MPCTSHTQELERVREELAECRQVCDYRMWLLGLGELFT